MKTNNMKSVEFNDFALQMRKTTYSKRIKGKDLTFNSNGKMLLGATYALTLDPGSDDLGNFVFTVSGAPLTSNNPVLLANPTPTSQPVFCEQIHKIRRSNCTIIYFKLHSKAIYNLPKLYLDVRGPHIEGLQFVSGPGTKEFSDYMNKEMYYLNTKSDKYIITDDVTNIDQIGVVTA